MGIFKNDLAGLRPLVAAAAQCQLLDRGLDNFLETNVFENMCVYKKPKVTDPTRPDNVLKEYGLMSPGCSENICRDTFSYFFF